MQMLDFVFTFVFYYLLLYRVNAVKSIDLYQNYLSEKKKKNYDALVRPEPLSGLYVCEC